MSIHEGVGDETRQGDEINEWESDWNFFQVVDENFVDDGLLVKWFWESVVKGMKADLTS